MVRVQHDCPPEAAEGARLLADCVETATTAASIAITSGVVVVLALAGLGIWLWVRKRIE